MQATTSVGRRPTAPIPPHLVERFFGVAWAIADGSVAEAYPEIKVTGSEHLARRHALACLWLAACAMRFSELRRLRAADVSLTGGTAFIQRSKHGRSGHQKLSRRLVSLTFAWRDEQPAVRKSVWLIPSATGQQLSANAFNRDACGMFREILGIKLSSHCFRDTACQLALKQGASIRKVQRLLGHKSADTTEIYIRKQDEESVELQISNGVN